MDRQSIAEEVADVILSWDTDDECSDKDVFLSNNINDGSDHALINSDTENSDSDDGKNDSGSD